jgi:hypothetical protein
MTPESNFNAPGAKYASLNEQFRRMLACMRSGGPEGHLEPAFAEEEAKLCDLLLPVLTRLARGREEWANGALVELCCRWRRGLMNGITPWYLNVCIQEAARRECIGWVPVLAFEATNRADVTPKPATELIRRSEEEEARRQLARLCEEVPRFVGSLADCPDLQGLVQAMLWAGDLSRGFWKRYAGEQGTSPGTISKWKEKLEERFDHHLRAAGLPPNRLRLSGIVLALREFYPDGLPGLETAGPSAPFGGEELP